VRGALSGGGAHLLALSLYISLSMLLSQIWLRGMAAATAVERKAGGEMSPAAREGRWLRVLLG